MNFGQTQHFKQGFGKLREAAKAKRSSTAHTVTPCVVATLERFAKQAQCRADIAAKHGPVRVLYKDGKPVNGTLPDKVTS